MVYFDFKKPPPSDPVAGTRGGEGIDAMDGGHDEAGLSIYS